MCEVLAPAGDESSFYAALNSGADAIYLGLKDFSARKSAANFTLENLGEYTRYAHVLGAKVYVALNTLVKDKELSSFFHTACAAWSAGADALILQDIFLGKALKEMYPQMVLHLSTQAGVCNIYGARLAKRMGFSRVILARETPFDDIKKIASEIETEVFVQGALCTCFSGQCYFSSFVGGNSGNRGFCKQPCRKRYRIDRKGFEKYSYKLSLSDLCLGDKVLKLQDAGVQSFKIEGRMRSAAYVGTAVKYYKDLFSRIPAHTLSDDLSELKQAYNRGDYTRGYVFGQDGNLLSSDVQGHKGERIGTVSRSKNVKFTFIRSEYIPRDGDGFKIIRGEKEEVGGDEWRSIYPKKAGGFYLMGGSEFREGDGVYLTSSVALQEKVAHRKRLVPLRLSARISVNARPCVRVCGEFGVREFTADFCAEAAQKQAFTENDFIECFQKTGEYPFRVTVEDLNLDGKCFIVKSALNNFRRKIYESIYELLAGQVKGVKEKELKIPPMDRKNACFGTAVIDTDFSSVADKVKIDYAIFRPKNYKNQSDYDEFFNVSKYYAWHKYLYLPAYCLGSDLNEIENHLDGFEGVYAEGTFALEWCKEKRIKVFAGTGFNLFNEMSVAMMEAEGVENWVLSKELSESESRELREKSFSFVGGCIKVMELGHCLFRKDCKQCDRRARYNLTDEQGRNFPLYRYENSVCRFEVYNNALLVSAFKGRANLYDFTILSERGKELFVLGKEEQIEPRTSGAYRRGVL